MKANIHPTWYPEAQVICACGNMFSLGATLPKIEVEVCYNCHPFYTGQMKYVDTAGRVDAFRAKQEKAKENILNKTEKRRIKKEKKIQKELERPETLEELRKQAKNEKRKAKS